MICKIKDIAKLNPESLGRNYEYDKIKYLDTANITNGFINNIVELNIDEAPSRAKRIVRDKDIIYSTVRPNLCHYGFIEHPDDNMIVSTGFAVIRCNENVDPYYVYLYLTLPEIVKSLHLLAENSTSAYPSIKPKDIGDLEIELPDLETQRKISKILYTLKKKVETNNYQNEILSKQMKNIYNEWFINYNIPNYNYNFKNTEMGNIPENWEIVNLEDVIEFQEGPGIRNWQYVDDGIKFINIKCIKDNDLDLKDANMISIEEANGKYNHFLLNEWDVIMSTSGTLGKNEIIRKDHLPLCLNTSVIRFKPKENFNVFSYMYNYLISDEFMNLLNSLASGSVQANFGPTHLKQIKMVYPENKIITEFEKISFPLIKKIVSNKYQNKITMELLNNLLIELMHGNIEVDNVAL